MVVGTDLVIFPGKPIPQETTGATVTREEDEMTAAATAPDQGTAAPTPAGALSQLIREVNESGVTYQEMADRGITPDGGRLPRQWYQKLVKTPPVNPPSVGQMRAIASATGMPFRRIQEAAAAQWLMYEATELAAGDTVRIIVSHLIGMPDSEKRKWQAMIEAAERARRREEDE